MDALRLALRGLRWRAGASLAVLVVAVVASAAAALGPLYARSAEESLVRDGVAQQPPISTGVQTRGSVAGQTEYSPLEVRQAVADRAADPALDPWYSPATLSLTVLDGSPSVDGHPLGRAQVSWYQGQCGAVTVVDGRCPDAPGQAMVSVRVAESTGLGVGSEINLGITSDPTADSATVVGTYDPTTADPAVWGLARPAQFETARIEGAPDRLDEFVVDEATMLRSNGDVTAVSLRVVDADTVYLDDLTALSDAVVASTVNDVDPSLAAPRTTSTSGMPDYLDSLQPQLDGLAAASFAVTAQLVLLAWFVLFLVISATSDERSGEVALAKLRGMTTRATLAFGLAEPLLLLLVATPIGLVLAWATDVALTRNLLVPGTTVSISGPVVVALLVCLLGGAAAAALAARGILTAPVLDQLRRTGGRRARLARSAAVDAAAVALAAAGLYELSIGASDRLALLAPGLVALAAGLLAVRVLPLLARAVVARTRATTRVASFLASRNIARRPGGLRIVVLLSLAVGLAVFAVDGWVVSAANRADLARATVGAAQVLHVRAASPGELASAVAAADPSGVQAMVAVGVDNGEGGLLAVDASRIGAVSSWDPAWVGSTASDIGPLLHPASPASPLPVHGRLSVRVDYQPATGAGPVRLVVAVRAASGLSSELVMGLLRAGSSRYEIELPNCVAAPCTLGAFLFRHPVDVPAVLATGTVTLDEARDADGAVDLSAPGQAGWRSGAGGVAFPIEPGAAVIDTVADGALELTVTVTLDDAAVEVADHPLALPVVQGSDLAAASGDGAAFPVVAGLDGRFTPSSPVGSGVLPRLLRQGSLVDLTYALAVMGTRPSPLDAQVWLAPGAPASITESLTAAGVEVVSVESVEDRVAELNRSGSALALRLFLLAAIAALVLGAGTLLANAYVVIRRRAYELAALKAIGATDASLVRASRREQLALAITGLLLGAASGLVAAGFALPPLVAESTEQGPPAWYGPAWVPVVLLLATVLVLLAVVADIGARRTVRRALPELLRQVQE